MHANYSAVNSGPLFTTLVAEAVARYFDPSVTVQMSLHPLPLTYKESQTLNSYNTAVIVTFILLAIPFIPGNAWF